MVKIKEGGGNQFRQGGSRTVIVMLCITCLLNSCTLVDEARIDFLHDPYILRGTWIGKTDNNVGEVSFSLKAEYIDSEQYRVSGTVYNSGTALGELDGFVKGHKTAYLMPLASSIPSKEIFIADIIGPNGENTSQICVESVGAHKSEADVFYLGFMGSPNSFSIIDGLFACSHPVTAQAIKLTKIENSAR